MAGKKKIIVITDYPFNRRDYDRFGIATLRDHGLIVEIWDITSYLHKNYRSKLVEEDNKNFKDLRKFKEKYEIVNAISCLDKACLINYMIEYSFRTFFILKAISKYKIDYCVWGMATLPNPNPIQNSFIERIISIIKKGNPLKFKETIQYILNKILLKYYFIFGISPASIILLGGEKSMESTSYPINKTTIRLWTHHPDYDIYLQHKTEINDSCKTTGVFLDQYLPLHPDYLHSDIEFPISPDNYYPNLCIFFKTLEIDMNVGIVVAAHPRSDYENLPDYFCGRTIIKGETARLIRESSFVIAHSSTSIDFAVLYNKPILFITTDDLDKLISGKNIIGLYIRTIACELGKKPINIDHLSGFNWKKEMEINETSYIRYRNLYIKKQGAPEKPLWDIFCSYIQQDYIL